MSETEITKKDHFNFSEKQETFEDLYQRKLYKKLVLQLLNNSANIIAGGSTSNQLENSSGLIGGS